MFRSVYFKMVILTGISLSIFFQFTFSGRNVFAGSFVYEDFLDTSGLYAVGDARFLGSKIRLSEASEDIGALWYTTKEAVGSGFTTIFYFQIGANTTLDCEQCCGLAFVI